MMTRHFSPLETVVKALRVLECLFEDGFSAKTLKQIQQATGIHTTTAWRLLQSLKAVGWVVEVATSAHCVLSWQVSDKLAAVASQYRRQALADTQAIERNYLTVTGENLADQRFTENNT